MIYCFRFSLFNWHVLIALASGLCSAAPAGADETSKVALIGASTRTGQRIEEARQDVKNKLFSKGIEQLQNVIESSASDLVLVPGSQGHHVAAHWLCQWYLARLPVAALKSYRQRVEEQARKWLEEGKNARSTRLLRRVVDQAFCSRSTEEALNLLGDLAFDEGRLAEAERWWSMLAPLEKPAAREDQSPTTLTLTYPDPTCDVARIQAKQLLARWFQGEVSETQWKKDLAAFRARHPQARGRLAGDEGLYSDVLQKLAKGESRASAGVSQQWRTMAGDASRNGLLRHDRLTPRHLNQLFDVGKHWNWELPGKLADEGLKVVTAKKAAKSLAFHPVIVGGHVVIADALHVYAHDLHTGKRTAWHDESVFLMGVEPNVDLPTLPDLSYTLTATDDCILVRFGSQELGAEKDDEKEKKNRSSLVCLNLPPGRDGKRLRWRAVPDAANNAVFEGTAVADEHHAYAAVTRTSRGQATTAIHCYPLASQGRPEPRWQRDVCLTSELNVDEPRRRHHLLTLEGGRLFYCSHTGAIVALDAETGQRLWARRYLSRGEIITENRSDSPRDLAPCIVSDERVFVAPADTDHLLCLDASTGRLLWQRDGVEVVQLMGVTGGKLLFATDTPRPGVRAVRAATGSDVWYQHGLSSPFPTSHGRGLLTSEVFFWPTLHRLYVMRVADGAPTLGPTRLHRFPSGNLVFVNGVLVIAGRKHLHAYVSAKDRLQSRRHQVEQNPTSARARYRLAASLADAGRHEEALRKLKEGQRLDDGRAPSDGTRQALHTALLRAARQEKELGEALKWLRIASGSQFSPSLRAEALVQQVRFLRLNGKSQEARNVCATMLRDEQLQDVHVLDERGNPQMAQILARQCERLPSPLGGEGSEESPATANPPHPQPLSPEGRGGQEAAAKPPHPQPLSPEGRGEQEASLQWELAIPSNERFVIPENASQSDVLFSATCLKSKQHHLTRYDVATGKSLWRCKLPFAVTWIEVRGDALLGVGPTGAAQLNRQDGALAWHYRAPSGTTFTRAASEDRLLLVQDRRRLFALDVDTGYVRWTRWCPGAYLRTPHVPTHFTSTLQAWKDVVHVALADGTHWLLDAQTGTITKEWSSSPPERVAHRNARTGAIRWRRDLENHTTLSGAPPHVIGEPPAQFLIVSRNYGTTIHRVHNGNPTWTKPILLPAASISAENCNWSGPAFHVASDDALASFDVKDGRLLWRRSLEGRGQDWHVHRVDDCLFTYPVKPIRAQFSFRSLLGTLQWSLTLPLEAQFGHGFPILIFDAKTGTPVQRVSLTGGPPDLRCSLLARGTKAPSSAQEQPPVPRLRNTKAGVLVVLGSRAWLLQR